MSKIDIYEVVTKLVGPIDPVGDTRADDSRYENLLAIINLIDRLLNDVDSVSCEKDRQEYSVSRAGLYADKFMASLEMKRKE